MRRVLLWSVATAAVLHSGLTLAADMPAKAKSAVVAAPVVASYNWAGAYIGANCGAAWGRTTTSNVPPVDDDFKFSDHLNRTGWLCGGQVGYNWQAGTWVYGLEGDLGYIGIKKRIETTPAVDSGDTTQFTEVKYGWYATATGRLGVAWDRWLPYLKGGAAWAKIRNTFGELNDTADFSEINKTRTGWALGGGFEYGFAPNWTWKLEYLYMDFGSDRTKNDDAFYFDHENKVHTLKFGVNYKS